MSYVNAGPVSVTDGSPLDSPAGAVTTEGFDDFSLPYTVNFDTEWSLGWNYFPNDYSVPANAMVRFRLQPGGGALNVILATREASGDFVDRNSGSIPYVLGEDINLRPTRNAAGLLSLMSGATTIVSATPPHPIAVNEGILHWGNTTPGSDMVLANINYTEAAPVNGLASVTNVDTNFVIYKNQTTFEVTGINFPAAVHSWGFRFNGSNEEATPIARDGDKFTLGITAAIQALPDSEILTGKLWFRPLDYVEP